MSESTETPPDVEVDSRRKLRERWTPLGLVLAGGLWNLMLTPFSDAIDEDDWRAYPFFAAFGVIYAQPALCAVWGALSAHSWIWRLPAGTAACIFLSLMMFGIGDTMDALVLLLMVYLLCLMVLIVIRWKSRLRLGTVGDAARQQRRSSSYGIRYLFLWMSVAALLAAFGKVQAVGPVGWALGELVFWTFAFALLFSPSVWLFAYLLRLRSPRWFGVIIVFAVSPIVSLVACYAVWRWDSGPSFWLEMYVPFTLLGVGAMLGVAMVAAVLRWAGYRIYRIHSA